MSVDLENRLNKQWSICLQKADKANNQAHAYFYIIIHCWSVSVCGLTPDKQQQTETWSPAGAAGTAACAATGLELGTGMEKGDGSYGREEGMGQAAEPRPWHRDAPAVAPSL